MVLKAVSNLSTNPTPTLIVASDMVLNEPNCLDIESDIDTDSGIVLYVANNLLTVSLTVIIPPANRIEYYWIKQIVCSIKYCFLFYYICRISLGCIEYKRIVYYLVKDLCIWHRLSHLIPCTCTTIEHIVNVGIGSYEY